MVKERETEKVWKSTHIATSSWVPALIEERQGLDNHDGLVFSLKCPLAFSQVGLLVTLPLRSCVRGSRGRCGVLPLLCP